MKNEAPTKETARYEEGDDRQKGPILSSWVVSLLLHLVILALLFWIIQSRPRPGSVQGGRTADSVGIVFSEPDASNGHGKGEETAGRQETPVEETPEKPEETESAIPAETPQSAENLIGMNSPAVTIHRPTTSGDSDRGDALGSGDEAGSGSAGGQPGSGQTVGFGGLKGTGRRFVYVLDRSESMRWPGDLPIRYALAEARASIESLDPKKGALKFQLVVYNHDARVFGNGRLLDVNPENRKKAADFLDSLSAEGGTDPLAALEKAISLRPDVIFFLTDADEEIPPMVLTRIREARLRARVGQIHVMEFGRPDVKKTESFRRLADENNGVYLFKDVTRL